MKTSKLLATASFLLFSAKNMAFAQTTDLANPLVDKVTLLLSEASKEGFIKNKYLADQKVLADLISNSQMDAAKRQTTTLISQISSDFITGQVKADALNNRSIVPTKKLQKNHIEAINQYLNGLITAEELVQKIKPTNSHYQKLVRTLQRYQNAIAEGKILKAPATLVTINKDTKDQKSILYARFRLGLLGYTNDESNPAMSDDLMDAILAFQNNQNLVADGVIGPGSWRALNQDIAAQISQLKISIDRTRWLPNDLGTNHVFVNLAQQRLQLYMNSELSMEFKTINGRLDRQTPIIFDTMTHMLLNPTWTVPQNILIADKVPMFTANPRKVIDMHMKIIDDVTEKEIDPMSVDWTKITEDHIPFSLVQQPGRYNALGVVKFPLLNPYSIYLHDTDSRDLFAKTNRLLSSGCVRLEKPLEFAEKVLNSADWNLEKLKDATENAVPTPTSSTRVRLSKNIPVYLFYLTASVNSKDQLVLMNDSYDIDMKTYDVLTGK